MLHIFRVSLYAYVSDVVDPTTWNDLFIWRINECVRRTFGDSFAFDYISTLSDFKWINYYYYVVVWKCIDFVASHQLISFILVEIYQSSTDCLSRRATLDIRFLPHVRTKYKNPIWWPNIQCLSMSESWLVIVNYWFYWMLYTLTNLCVSVFIVFQFPFIHSFNVVFGKWEVWYHQWHWLLGGTIYSYINFDWHVYYHITRFTLTQDDIS